MDIIRLADFKDLSQRMYSDAKAGKTVYSILFFWEASDLMRDLLKL